MIEIRLNQTSVPLGGTINGEVTWTAPKDATPRKIQAALTWYTEGRGSTAKDVITTCDYNCGPVAANESVSFPFEFQIPDDVPVSFNGRLIRLIWAISVFVDLPWAFDPKDAAVFEVTGLEVPA